MKKHIKNEYSISNLLGSIISIFLLEYVVFVMRTPAGRPFCEALPYNICGTSSASGAERLTAWPPARPPDCPTDRPAGRIYIYIYYYIYIYINIYIYILLYFYIFFVASSLSTVQTCLGPSMWIRIVHKALELARHFDRDCILRLLALFLFSKL